MPVRAKVRGTFDVQLTSTLMVSPGATGAGSGTAITVWSFGLPSSGLMYRRRDVRSTGVESPVSRRTALMSIQPISSAGAGPLTRPPITPSRIHVEAVFFHAL